MAKPFSSSLGPQIRALRKKKGWRQSDLAAHAELPETYVSEIETGKRDVGLNALQKLSAALDVKLSEIFRLIGS